MSRGLLMGRSLVVLLVSLVSPACHVQVNGDRFANGARGDYHLTRTSLTAAASDDAFALPEFSIDLRGREVTADGDVQGVLRVRENGALTLQTPVSVELHGESSAGLAKKSYRIELRDDAGNDRAMPLVGLPAGSDWVLHGCGADRTCLRNVLAYEIGRSLERYAPRTGFLELTLGGEYRGLYVLVERVRRDRYRVNLPRPSATADGDITGGYIFKLDLGEGHPTDAVPRDWVSPVSRLIYSYYYPRHTQITSAQKAYLQDFVGRFEAAMQGPAWNSAEAGYRRWLDVPSWVDFAILQELSVNPDAYFKSVYLQKLPRAQGDQLALGPVWDFDLAFGMAEFRDARNTGVWAHRMNRFGTLPVSYSPPGTTPYVPAFWERLWSDPAFQAAVQCRWRELREGPLHVATLHGWLDRWRNQLADAQPRDAAVWGNPPANAFAGEVETLKAFLEDRLVWMDTNLPGRCTT